MTAAEYQLFIGGRWVPGGEWISVTNKYTGEVVAALPSARPQEVEAAVRAAEEAAPRMAELPSRRRAEILVRTSQILQERREEFARMIAVEAGKAIKYARAEVDRGINIFEIAAEEAKRIHGETVPLDAVPSGRGYFGFYLRRPVGVVVAISPFNFPLNLVVHKVAPALAAGNSLVLKPASATPLTAVLLCQALEAAGLPAGAINLVAGPGASVGEQLVADPRVAKVSFTGSAEIGRRIAAKAGLKRVTLELGNSSPVIIAPDADFQRAARRCAVGAFYNSGQVCISVQRIYTEGRAFEPFAESFLAAAQSMVVGDPLDERVDVGPMISEGEARRIESWVAEAQKEGARVAVGGKREGAVYFPTVLLEVKPGMRVVREEAFAPVASIIRCEDFGDALRQADATEYGLQAALFTHDIQRILKAIRGLNFGGLIVNDSPSFRADHMPFGGNRQSGVGREGVRFAIEEMTNLQMVVLQEPEGAAPG